MHEASVVQGLLEAAVAAARRGDGGRITEVSLVIGEASGISDEAVNLHFDLLSRGTLAEGARVSIRRESASWTCWGCGGTFPAVPGGIRRCPGCGSRRVDASRAALSYVESIDVEDRAGGEEPNMREAAPAKDASAGER